MSIIELRDLDEARRFVLQGLWLQKVIFPPSQANLRTYLEWALEIASSGDPLPSVGFIADVGSVVFALDRGERRGSVPEALPFTDDEKNVLRQYEDFVLGKIYADGAFERACDALRGYERGVNWSRGLAFLIKQYCTRAHLPGLMLSPAVIRTLRDAPSEETLLRGKEMLAREGIMPLLLNCYKGMTDASKQRELSLTNADVRALENGIALAEPSQQLAHKQVMETSDLLRTALPANALKPLAGRQEVPTRVLDEDTYPVGGYSAIASKGSIESLLHSQLAFMEPGTGPDLFDIKYLRDELYYYSRDENQFLRRRRTFVVVLYPDLVVAKYHKGTVPVDDGGQARSYECVILLQGLIHAAIQKLIECLDDRDALKFDLVFMNDAQKVVLPHEYELARLIFREQIENHTVELFTLPTPEKVVEHCQERARRSLCHCLTTSMIDRPLEAEDTPVTRLVVGPNPELANGFDAQPTPLDDWPEALERLLRFWI